MRRRYARIRRIEAQAAYQRKKAEARLQSVSNLEATASETEKGVYFHNYHLTNPLCYYSSPDTRKLH